MRAEGLLTAVPVQYWIMTEDKDVEKYLKLFTLVSDTEIESVMQEHNARQLRFFSRSADRLPRPHPTSG